MIKLKDLMLESLEEENKPKLSLEEKKQLMEMISTYNEFGKQLYRENKLIELAKKLSEVAKSTKSLVEGENEDWFDGITKKEDMKQLERCCEEFHKLADTADKYQTRMEALYENMGHTIQRYVSIK